jgi:hypothetical protein
MLRFSVIVQKLFERIASARNSGFEDKNVGVCGIFHAPLNIITYINAALKRHIHGANSVV